MSPLDVAAGLAVLAGALLQSAVGFGFSLVCAPLVLAATGPEQAIGLLTLLGIEMNVLTLAGEGRRPRPLARVAASVLAWSIPGMLAGVAVLRAVDGTALQVVLTVAVLAGLGVQRWARRHQATRPAPAWATPAAGLTAGALTTSTSAAGPPLVLLLRGRGTTPERIRDTLTVAFLGLAVLAAAVLVATGTSEAIPTAGAIAACVPLVAVGHVAGRAVFRRLAVAQGRYEAVLTAVLVTSAVVGLLVALL